MLTDHEKYRYNRHLILDQIGEKGQEKLKASSVLVIGAGGLGCPVLQYLTAAGVGTIGILDFDKVDESNLQRQILYTIEDIGKSKAICAAERLNKLNPHVNFKIYNVKLIPENALEILGDFDIVIDGTDNFPCRYLVNDACVILNKPLVYGSIFKFEGQVTVFNCQDGPSYRCLFPEAPLPGSVPSCSEIGVLGVLPGIIGNLQANEALKLILGIGESLNGKLMIYNALNATSTILKINRNQEIVDHTLSRKDNFKENDYEVFCGVKDKQDDEINLSEFKEFMKEKNIFILDVREIYELPRVEYEKLLIAPSGEIESFIAQIPKEVMTVVVCHSGRRSRMVVELLKSRYKFENLLNLKGGLQNYDG